MVGESRRLLVFGREPHLSHLRLTGRIFVRHVSNNLLRQKKCGKSNISAAARRGNLNFSSHS